MDPLQAASCGAGSTPLPIYTSRWQSRQVKNCITLEELTPAAITVVQLYIIYIYIVIWKFLFSIHTKILSVN